MKIAQLCVRYPPAPGGVEVHVYEIAKRLSARGYDVDVYTTDLYTETPFIRLTKRVTIDGATPVRVRAFTMAGDAHYLIYPGVFRIIGKKYDIVHAHSYGYFHHFAAFLYKRLNPSTKYVLTPHFHPIWSMWGGEKRKKLRKIYDRVFGRMIISATDAIIGVSQHEIEVMSEYFDLSHSVIAKIPNGVDMGRFTPIPTGDKFREKYSLHGKKIILFVGRLAVNKGLQDLISAFYRVQKDINNAHLVIVGEDAGMKDAIISDINALGIMDKVTLTGHINENMLKEAYGACDVFVLPSEYEAFGIVLLEAMACAKPCVATRVGGMSEIVAHGKTGFLVEYGNDEELAEAISELLLNEEKSKAMGAEGRKVVEAMYSWDKVVDKIIELYNSL